MLANLYMNRFLKHWRITGKSKVFRAQVVTYADDFVILSRGHASEALDWTRSVMTQLGLTLNETKTSIKTARKESFHFLGYTFGPHRYKPDGHWYLGSQSLEEEPTAYQAESGRPIDTRKRWRMGRSARSPQPDSARLVGLLFLRLSRHGVPRSQQLRL